MKKGNNKPIKLVIGYNCLCTSKKIKYLNNELPPEQKKSFKINPSIEVSHYLLCPNCKSYSAIKREGVEWF